MCMLTVKKTSKKTTLQTKINHDNRSSINVRVCLRAREVTRSRRRVRRRNEKMERRRIGEANQLCEDHHGDSFPSVYICVRVCVCVYVRCSFLSLPPFFIVLFHFICPCGLAPTFKCIFSPQYNESLCTHDRCVQRAILHGPTERKSARVAMNTDDLKPLLFVLKICLIFFSFGRRQVRFFRREKKTNGTFQRFSNGHNDNCSFKVASASNQPAKTKERGGGTGIT